MKSRCGPSASSLRPITPLPTRCSGLSDGHSTELRRALGRRHGIDPDRIVCGLGSDDIIHLLAEAYAGEGDEVIYSYHGFSIYPIAALTVGAKPIAAPETNLTFDVDAVLALVTPRTKLVFIANPQQSDRHLHSA